MGPVTPSSATNELNLLAFSTDESMGPIPEDEFHTEMEEDGEDGTEDV